YCVDRFEITKANFQTVRSASFKILIIETLAVSNTITMFIKNNKWNKYHINGHGISDSSVQRLMDIPAVLLKRCICIYFYSLHVQLFKISFWIQKFYRRIFKLNIVIEKMGVGFVIFLNRTLGKQVMSRS